MKMKMNQEVKAKWTTALKSGDYQQGTCALRTVEGKFCCLGVLCELAVKADVIPPAHLNAEYGNYSYGEIRVGIGNNGYLPSESRGPDLIRKTTIPSAMERLWPQETMTGKHSRKSRIASRRICEIQ